MKTTKETRSAVTAAATGDGLRTLGVRGVGNGHVVQWNEDGSCVRPGPEQSHYEAVERNVERTCCSTRSGLLRTVVFINC